MNEVKTTTKLDATEYLTCRYCVKNYGCKRYSLICELEKKGLFIACKLLCTLEAAEWAATECAMHCIKEKINNASLRGEIMLKNFLPQINNLLCAFYNYECEKATIYDKRAIIIALGSTLENYDVLTYFDIIFRQDLQSTFEECLNMQELELATTTKNGFDIF